MSTNCDPMSDPLIFSRSEILAGCMAYSIPQNTVHAKDMQLHCCSFTIIFGSKTAI